MKLEIKAFQLGQYLTNCYLVWNSEHDGYLFDCGGINVQELVKFIEKEKINLKGVIFTHGHYDHIGGLKELIKIYPEILVYIGEEEAVFLKDSSYNLSELIDGTNFKYEDRINLLKDGDVIGDFTVISTPGHTKGSKCFYNEENNIMISGDTMFKNSFGRCDLPTGNEVQLMESLKKLCENYPENTLVYSAHSDVTTIGVEREFLKSLNYI